jgi:hypothetical protein
MILVRNKPYNICGARKRPDIYAYFFKMGSKSRFFIGVFENIVKNIGYFLGNRMFQVKLA